MKPRQPTELERRVLEAVWNGVSPFLRCAGVHPSLGVVTRAVNWCHRRGWLRKKPVSRGLRLTAAGRKALLAAKAVKP